MRRNTGGGDGGDAHRAEDQPGGAGLVHAQHDMVHVPGEAGQDHQQHVNDDEADVAHQQQEVERARPLPASEQSGIPLEAVIEYRGHGEAGQYGQRGHDEHDGGVGQLLHGIVEVEAVRLRR